MHQAIKARALFSFFPAFPVTVADVTAMDTAFPLIVFLMISHPVIGDPRCWQKNTFCLFVDQKKEVSFQSPPDDRKLVYSLTGEARNSRHEWKSVSHLNTSWSVSINFTEDSTPPSRLHFHVQKVREHQQLSLQWIIGDKTKDLSPWFTLATKDSPDTRFTSNEKISSIFQLHRKRHQVSIRVSQASGNASIPQTWLIRGSKQSFLLFHEDEDRRPKSSPWFRRSTIIVSCLMLTLFILLLALMIVDTFVLTQEAQ